MKNYYYILLLLVLVILINIFIIGKVMDLLTVPVLVIMYFFSRRIRELKKIFFFAATGCLLLSVILYCFSAQNPLYDIAANWTYSFLAAGAVAMLIEELTNEKNK